MKVSDLRRQHRKHVEAAWDAMLSSGPAFATFLGRNNPAEISTLSPEHKRLLLGLARIGSTEILLLKADRQVSETQPDRYDVTLNQHEDGRWFGEIVSADQEEKVLHQTGLYATEKEAQTEAATWVISNRE